MSAMGHSRRCEAGSEFGHVRCAAEAEVNQSISSSATDVIQAPKPEPRIMRYELSDYEWTAIKPMLANKPRGIRRI
jgi:hypothetical protein